MLTFLLCSSYDIDLKLVVYYVAMSDDHIKIFKIKPHIWQHLLWPSYVLPLVEGVVDCTYLEI
ncbi:hypothetical protein FRX31_004862 [Thalictrum thalictroides]|uniref:Uncharacterized protein n=1 Tax=Thalictrum thalictroides TaxID=46969 RepID=A0A7J6X702_THATH|nr:hypothetical protein FRX31_004862 [Thalictrum thalictroides]